MYDVHTFCPVKYCLQRDFWADISKRAMMTEDQILQTYAWERAITNYNGNNIFTGLFRVSVYRLPYHVQSEPSEHVKKHHIIM